MTIYITDNFLPHELYIECYNYAISKYNSNELAFKTNNLWDNEIVMDSKPILIHTLDNSHNLYNKLKSYIINNSELSNNLELTNSHLSDLNFYFYTPGAHIPWHNDINHVGGITIYLNKEWKDNWGGALLYKHNDSKMIDGGIYPKQNRAIIITNNIAHTVIPTTCSSDIRISIQCFVNSNNV